MNRTIATLTARLLNRETPAQREHAARCATTAQRRAAVLHTL